MPSQRSVPSSPRLEGRAILVTGSTRGIGRAIAERAALEGALVVVTGRDASAGEMVVSSIEATGGRALFHPADVTRADEVEALVAAAADAGSVLRGLVVNAASVELGNGDGPVTEIELADWERMMTANLTSVFLTLKFGLRAMVDAKGGGSVVLIGSLAATRGLVGMDGYTTAKGGMAALNRSVATYYSRYRIRCNYVSLGLVDSGTERAVRAMQSSEFRRANAAWQLGRIGRPEEVATVAAHLLSDESSFMNGAQVPLDGGAFAASHKPQPSVGDLPGISREAWDEVDGEVGVG
ncbi:SDR family NAD(P)-dependent oxidoreductase (plasmid) [Nocardioides sp. R1-1]|uniref:SDR family NAD(P)-dependent oxidoreductase n=1 Tax=Nocardioides sp. R1-1 TaxID=3383502 RepID=UPI0038D10588